MCVSNFPGGGARIVDFMVRMWFGVRGSGLDESLRQSVVRGLLFTTAMTSYRNVPREEQSSCVADCSILWDICHSLLFSASPELPALRALVDIG